MSKADKVTVVHCPPPKDALVVYKWDDLPSKEAKALYEIQRSDGTVKRTVQKKNRRLLEALLSRSVVSASRARVSQCKAALNDLGFDVHTFEHHWDGKVVGVYRLRDQVKAIGEVSQ